MLAASLLLLSLGLLTLASAARVSRLGEVAASLAAALGLFTTLSYLYDLPKSAELSLFGPHPPLAAGIAVLAISLGILLLGRRTWLAAIYRADSPALGTARWLLPIAVATPIVLAAVNLGLENEGWVSEEMSDAIIALVGAVLITSAVVLATRHATDLENQAAASERRYAAAIEAAPAGVLLVGGDGRISLVNRRLNEMFGYAPGELLGSSVERLIPERFVGPHAAYRRTFALDPRGRQMGLGRELFALRRDGSEFPVEIGLSPVSIEGAELVLATVVDLSERKETEAAFRTAESRLSVIADHTKEAFFLNDLTPGGTLYISPSFSEIWGRSAEEACQDRSVWLDGIHPDDRKSVEEAIEAASSGEPSERTFRVVRPDGTERWVRGRVFAVRDALGNVLQVAGLSEDVTEQRSAEMQLRQAQKMEAVGRLAGGVAHDFNNILTAILGHTDFLAHAQLDPQAREDLAGIREAATRAAELTSRLLTFSRQQTVEPRAVRVCAVVRGTERMLRRLIGEDIELVTRVSDDVGSVWADQGQLEQVIMNLVVNARDAMPNGGQLAIETSRVKLDAAAPRPGADAPVTPGWYAMLSISDTGHGMDAKTQARLFEPFFTTKAVGKGTGLGLATVHGIVKQCGGHVWVYSEVGRGSVFKVYLPLIKGEEEAPVESAPNKATGGRESILVVEDDLAVRSVAVRVLTRFGYQVRQSATPADALRTMAEQGAGSLSLVITDVVMPGMTGLELARAVREVDPDVRILFTSGYTPEIGALQTILSTGAAFLQKPYSVDGLAATTRAVLDSPTVPLPPVD